MVGRPVRRLNVPGVRVARGLRAPSRIWAFLSGLRAFRILPRFCCAIAWRPPSWRFWLWRDAWPRRPAESGRPSGSSFSSSTMSTSSILWVAAAVSRVSRRSCASCGARRRRRYSCWGATPCRPWCYRRSLLEVDGAALRATLEHSVEALPQPAGRFLQTAGLAYVLDATRPPGSRIVSVSVGGEALDPGRRYRVAVPDFLVRGGDGYTALAEARRVVPGVDGPGLSRSWSRRSKGAAPLDSYVAYPVVSFVLFGCRLVAQRESATLTR